MRAQIINNRIIGVGQVTGADTYELPDQLPENFEQEFHLYDAAIDSGAVELRKARSLAELNPLTISSLADEWQVLFKDYKQAREKLKELVVAVGGENLSPEEKHIAASWFVLSSEQIDQVLTFEDRVIAGKVFDANSAASRKARFDFAKSYLYNSLEKADGDNVVGMILQNGFKELYIEYGQEGTMKVNYKGETDRPGIFDFVLGTPEGVAAFNYRMIDLITVPKYGITPQAVVDRCIDILDHGNY